GRIGRAAVVAAAERREREGRGEEQQEGTTVTHSTSASMGRKSQVVRAGLADTLGRTGRARQSRGGGGVDSLSLIGDSQKSREPNGSRKDTEEGAGAHSPSFLRASVVNCLPRRHGDTCPRALRARRMVTVGASCSRSPWAA